MAPPPQPASPRFEACASTASLFLYAQGSTILCLHHDTLAIERRFQSHQENIEFISVDNVSERGAGRLVVSYDVGQTAIVWDIFTGTEIARFASFEHLRVAAWMRNGNVAFGNGKGEVILFEPPTQEHISARTIFDPITAMAPATDCRTHAIGYQNGSILIATLLPQFTILHTLTTSRGPSPIISLAWHASSSKQKSDMLATQSSNGDLRVWSVAKPPGKESPRVIRVLKRSDSSPADPKWMGWSKNGRLVQYLEGETWSWDVRTKHVTYDPIPTIDGVRGLANYGPTATLFTLGPQNSVQQYDLENPAMVANVQHLPVGSRSGASENSRSRTMSPRHLQDPPDIREPTSAVRRTPFDASGIESIRQRADLTSPTSSQSRTESVSSKASSSKYNTKPFSPPSRSGQSATTFSLTSAGGDTPQPSASAVSFAYPSSVSMSSVRSSRAASRLRNEVHLSPAEKNIVDLFPFTRARLNDVPYKQQPPLDDPNLTSDGLRQQMLSVVFGWDGDIEDLIRDELSRHALGSQSAILLAQWLGETDTDQMASMIAPGPTTTSDWMLLALSQMTGHAQANKVGQAFVQKLLEAGDTHTSAAILLGLGDSNDAIEVYVSRNHFMEAILMTCLLMPSDWQRQSYLVRRWGEHVVTHSQQQLAIRCFMCTGVEPSEPWASPSAQQAASFAEMIRAKSPLASPELSQANISSMMPPPIRPRSASNGKSAPKTPALKLITSFDAQPNQRFRFPGLKSDDRTPTNAPGITPIAESAVPDSALSPGGLGSWKLNNIQSLSHAMTSRTNTPSFNRRRLPSIGETPVDVHPPSFSRSGSFSQNEYGSTSENETSGHEHSQDERESDSGLLTLPSARYDPNNDSLKPSPQTAVQGMDKFATIKGLPSPAAGVFEALTSDDHRNGSRDRKPDGLQIELLDSERSHQEHAELIPSAKSTASTANSFTSAKSPSVSGRSIDQYISSLDEANFHARKYRGPHTPGRGRRNTDDAASQSSRVHQSRDASRDTRGRNDRRYIQPAKRSPSSPVPMSPEELARYGAGESEKAATKPKSKSRTRSSSKIRRPDSRARQRSSSRHTASRIADKREASNRGRSNDRQGSSARSPSSPRPMYFPGDEPSQTDGADDPMKFVASNQQRLRSRHRSASRRRAERGTSATSARRDASPESRHKTSQSLSEIQPGPKADPWAQESEPVQLLSCKVFSQEPPFSAFSNGQATSTANEFQDIASPTTPFVSMAERKRREFAAAELEARRLSLARNPSAPNIPFPGELQSVRSPIESPPPFSGGNSYFPRAPSRNKVMQSKASPEYPSSSDSNSSRSGMPVGLPATPRAMRHPKYGGSGQDEERPPSVPAIPSDTSLFLSSARYQGDAERIGRSMSVPVPEGQFNGTAPMPNDLPMHPRFNPALPRSRSSSRSRQTGHRRTSSGGYISGTSPNLAVSIEETIEQAMQRGPLVNYDNIPPPPPPPPILPELQHLNTPPPPSPFPVTADPVSPRESSATIDIAIDNNEDLGRLLPRAMTAAPAFNVHAQSVGPQSGNRRMSFDHRRNRSSNESFTNKLRSLTRMRSTASRSVEPWSQAAEPEMPYESAHSHAHGVASNQNYVLPSQSYVSPGQNFV
ncbi:hypothetical protein N7508_003461 [Penicillium antarcticum]|uniref:uncharacterized protein n=1 Tax=Penicillium antarcticum TaxID=416450 RepID=UPI0023A6A7A0|nr:uncharacterized protein N7508_003461 [Penicillium antarcticum]KAJ5312631.1 hypothetical protein N7508_003461 [Penicillium antarcticum]